MMPFNPYAVHYLWFLKWKERIRSAKSSQTNDAFCYAAQLCNMQYVTNLALETVKLKRAGIIKDENS